MNWKEEAKRELRNYAALKESLPNIRLRIESIEARMTSLKSMSSDTPVKGGGSQYEDRLLNCLVEKERLTATYKADKIRLHLIERGLAVLNETERAIVEEFAQNRPGRAVELLADRIGYERAQIYRLYDVALYRYTLAEYGIPEY
ncbi:MAG: hypothetical protein IJL26_01860 [Clostridia bacterium]|nr:hypothetical protein [Clostridia bacterium]